MAMNDCYSKEKSVLRTPVFARIVYLTISVLNINQPQTRLTASNKRQDKMIQTIMTINMNQLG